MKELIGPVKDFELTTGAFAKHFKDIDVKLLYDVVENDWDGKHYKDLVLYVGSPNSKDMFKANQAREEIVDELTDTDKCFMGVYAYYEAFADMLRKDSAIVLRKYDGEKHLY